MTSRELYLSLGTIYLQQSILPQRNLPIHDSSDLAQDEWLLEDVGAGRPIAGCVDIGSFEL
jgi:predicted oxidoreductase